MTKGRRATEWSARRAGDIVRLREERYTDARLKKWIEKLNAQDWDEAYVFFKHEDVGAGPKLAARFPRIGGVIVSL